jgi:hypothetical protein
MPKRSKKSSKKKRTLKRSSTRGCKRGQIRRVSYTRKSHIRKSGKRVKSIKVKSGCIKSRGKRGLKVIPYLRKGELTKYGYTSAKPASMRRRSLSRAVKQYSATSVFRKLNVLSTFNKNKSPSLASKFKSDRNWVRSKYM